MNNTHYGYQLCRSTFLPKKNYATNTIIIPCISDKTKSSSMQNLWGELIISTRFDALHLKDGAQKIFGSCILANSVFLTIMVYCIMVVYCILYYRKSFFPCLAVYTFEYFYTASFINLFICFCVRKKIFFALKQKRGIVFNLHCCMCIISTSTAIYPYRKTSSRSFVGNKLSRSVKCGRSIACRCCSIYIFFLELTPGCNALGKDSYMTRRETFQFRDFVWLILEVWRYVTIFLLFCMPWGITM